jgi:hypothetical protein
MSHRPETYIDPLNPQRDPRGWRRPLPFITGSRPTWAVELSHWMASQNLPDRYLAAKLGVHLNTIHRWRHGEFPPHSRLQRKVWVLSEHQVQSFAPKSGLPPFALALR